MYMPYLLCFVVGWKLLLIFEKDLIIKNDLARIFLVDLICTIIVFIFSYTFKNSSIYDPYWQLPTLMFAYYMNHLSPNPYSLKNIILITPITLYCLKLNIYYNRFWPGLQYEDFRYRDFC